MAGFDFASLTAEVGADEPCGPDLDLAGDPDFLNCVAQAEGLLPSSFFTRDGDGNLIPFDRNSIDIPAQLKVLDRLLETTRDYRLLTLYVRFLALNRDLAGVSDCMGAIAALSIERWDDVHPKGEGGDYGFRAAILQALDDMPTVVLPLQHVPLALSRRSGTVTFRTVMIAKGDAKGRPEDPVLDEAALERILTEEELDKLQATRERWSKIGAAADAIRLASIEKAGFDQAVTLDRLPDLVRKVLAVLDPILVKRDPTAVQDAGAATEEVGADPARPAAPAQSPAGAIDSTAAAVRALAAAGAYFSRSEPSNPAALIVRQAQDLIGKSFVDVLRTLVPRYAEDAKIAVGPDGILELTYQHLSTSNDAIASGRETAASEPGADEPQEGATSPAEAETLFQATSRQQASSLLDQIGAFFRRSEPSSPIPLLIDRARSLLDRDFAAILRDVLPDLVRRSN